MEAVVDEKLGLRENSLKVVRLLEKIITIPSHISMMSDESYNCHLTLIEQITFNVRNFLVFLLNLVLRLSFLTLVFSRFSWCVSISRDAGWLRRTWLLAHVIKKKKKRLCGACNKMYIHVLIYYPLFATNIWFA